MGLSVVVLYPAIALITTAIAGVCVWYKRPSLVLYGFLRYFLYITGLRLKFIRAGDYRFCYAERGKKSANQASVLMIHGFSASKDMWVPVVKGLPKDIHVIVIDLPGHGDSEIPGENHDISLPRYAQFVHQFVEAVGLSESPFHITGTSMGGLIAALYSSEYHDNVCKVTLICPAMHTPIETEFQKDMRETENVENCKLIPQTVSQTQVMLDSCSFSKVKMNKQVLQGVLDLRKPKTSYFKRLLGEIIELDKSEKGRELEAKVWRDCRAPTQIIWGKQDEIIHVSGTELLRERLPNLVRTDLIDNCGHTCNMERPGMVTKYLLEFIRDHKKIN